MGDKSAISWTDASWNAVVGCTQISPGCDHCYALTLHTRRHNAWKAGSYQDAPAQYHEPFERVQMLPHRLTLPLRWQRPRTIFVNSMSDLFHDSVPDAFIDQTWAVMLLAQRHTFQVLTKRPRRMRDYLSDPHRVERIERALVTLPLPANADHQRSNLLHGARERLSDWPLPNVVGMTTIEQDRYRWRADYLADTPLAVRGISAEPLLDGLPSLFMGGHVGPMRERHCALDVSIPSVPRCIEPDHYENRPFDWIIVGGESAGPAERALVESCPGTRCEHPDCYPHDHCAGHGGRLATVAPAIVPKAEALAWVRDLRDRAHAAGVAFHFKQWGGRTAHAGGRMLDGRTWDDMPTMPRATVLA